MPRRQSKERKPRRKPGFAHIYPRWSDAQQRWLWRPAIKVDGKLVWGRAFSTQDEAHEAAERMISEASVTSSTGSITLRAAFQRTVSTLLANGGSEFTKKGYEAKFKRFGEILNPDAFASEVTVEHLEVFKIERRKRHKVSSNTIRGDLRILGRVFRLAGIPDDRNPAGLVEAPREEEPDRPFFTLRQVAAIADRIRASGQPEAGFHADLILLLALTGIRAHELERLRAADLVETDDGLVLTVHGKTKRVRRVAIPGGFGDLARRALQRAADRPMLAASSISTVCTRWQKRLSEPLLTARNLRRSYATALAECAPLRTVQVQMGHTNLTTTQKYLGARDSVARAAAEQLGRNLLGGSA